jgi:hypothetical protein
VEDPYSRGLERIAFLVVKEKNFNLVGDDPMYLEAEEEYRGM